MSKLATHRNSLFSHDPFGIDRFFGDFNDWWLPEQITRDTRNVFPISSRKDENGTLSLFIEVPGYDKEDLVITFNQDTSVLSVSSQEETEGEQVAYRKAFNYRYTLKGYDPESLEATCERGILTIKASPYPKTKNLRKIEIK